MSPIPLHLSRLPVPSLQETCSMYLRSVEPLQSKADHAKTKTIVEDFVSSELATSLQQRLIDIDKASPYNWLEDNYWLRKAYLEWREALMVNSNWYMLGKDDAHHPTGEVRSGFTAFQVRRAAHMIHRTLEMKESIDQQVLPTETLKDKTPLCMWQYTRIFGVTRIPLQSCDTLVQQDPATIDHVVVLACDQVYSLPVYKQNANTRTRLSSSEIEDGLLAIVHHAQGLSIPQPPIPLLTSWHRDEWALARNHLLTIDPQNRASLDKIESGLFAVSLDDCNSGRDAAARTRTMFFGSSNLGHGHNRWYDKSLTLVVENNGQCAISGEHSPVDALTVSYVFDHMLREPVPRQEGQSHTLAPAAAPAPTHAQAVNHIQWKADKGSAIHLLEAQESANKIAALSDSDVLFFDTFGTDWVKKAGRVAPDAFFQMALQLTYYRLHGQVTATYETASTRKYLHGRTEAIRSCSTDSTAFVYAFGSTHLSAKDKYELLVKAVEAHREYTRVASDGHGCDRHLMVLRLLNADHRCSHGEPAPMHPMFTDPVFTESQTWRLSTSSLQAGTQLMGTGFGAVVRDGYGINYMAAPTLVKFGIESKRVTETVTTRVFADTLRQVLLDMKDMCEEVNGNDIDDNKKIAKL